MVDPVGLTAMQREMPERVLDVGIAEQLALDTAAGLSHGGAKPVVALYSTFLNRAFDQLLLDVALHDERSEERRVGKECRSGWSRYQYSRKKIRTAVRRSE